MVAVRGGLHEPLLRPVDELPGGDVADPGRLGRREPQSREHLAVVGDQHLPERLAPFGFLLHKLPCGDPSGFCRGPYHMSITRTDTSSCPGMGLFWGYFAREEGVLRSWRYATFTAAW